MNKYIFKKVLFSILIIIFTLSVNFILMRLAPGDPITILAGTDNPNLDMIKSLKSYYGLDKSLVQQLRLFYQNLLKGDLGYSYISNLPVKDIIKGKLKPTLILTLSSLLIASSLGMISAIYVIKNKESFISKVIYILSYIFSSMPSFWLGLILILIFSSKLRVFPTSGMRSLRTKYLGIMNALDIIYHAFLPVVTLSAIQYPYYFWISKSSIEQELSKDYINTFIACGMDKDTIYKKYLLKNSILPIITAIGMNLAFIFSGALLVESIFAWPGMGRLLVYSVSKRDYQVLMVIYLIISLSISVTSILLDIVYVILDPRIKYE